jgi:restriction endonuclease S subunit
MSEMEVPEGWELSTIGQISKIKGGSSCPNTEKLGVPLHFIKVSDMNLNENFQYIVKPNLIITTSKKTIVDKSIPPNSIIIPKRGGAILTNKKRITSERSLLDPNIMAIVPDDKIEPLFLYYFFLKTDLAQFVRNDIVPQINKYNIEPLEFSYPKDKKIQNKIIHKLDHVLGELEKKKKQIVLLIEQNKERINFFEKNWLSHVITNQIECHPQRKDWENVSLLDVASTEKNAIVDGPFGSNLLLSDYVSDGKIPVLTTKIMRNISEIKTARKISLKKFNELQRSQVRGGDILIAKIGSVGLTCLYPNDYPLAMIPANLCKITPNLDVIKTSFLKYWLDSNSFKRFLEKIVKKTAQPAFGITDFKKLLMPLPSITIQKQIIENIKTAEEKFQSQKGQFKNIKQRYESKIKYVDHIQSSILDSAFSGKLTN